MPLVKVEYDESKVGKDAMTKLCEALREIVIQSTNIPEVYVYANSSQIRIQVNPIEVFIEMSAHKVGDIEVLMDNIKTHLKERKLQNNFTVPITLTIIPMYWKFEVDI
jgi:hypothetical protein